ncbi:MAG: FtsW/RodA/SpoVE family cell cycle protein [Bryobacterales bacterium]|nr:FtsW/RodA/SpoVE family cell cycle protein [Bryobacteraceae bacterium]MDW8131161.1 FtsW/RodA/SpoVE family cell cycle protein [Bryobacterales bacterium]
MEFRPRLDAWLVGSMLLLLVFGLATVWSATQYKPSKQPPVLDDAGLSALLEADPGAGGEQFIEPLSDRAWKQGVWVLVGLAGMWLLRCVDYRRLNHAGWVFGSTALALAGLAAAYAVGERHRFLRFAGMGVQPSELAKPVLVLFLAYFIAQRSRVLNDGRTLAPAAMTLGLLIGGVMIADLGTAFVMLATSGAVFLAAGLQWRHVRTAAVVCALCTVLAAIVPGYRRERTVAFLRELPVSRWLGMAAPAAGEAHPEPESADRTGPPRRDVRYQQRQSLLALASGGLLGVGPANGRQKLGFLPEADNDFIYAVIGEEWGLIGCLGVLALYLVIWWRCQKLVRAAPDEFGRHLALGASFLIVFQALVNMSVVVKLLPAKGLPLPLISYGGSSMVATLALFGMLLSVRERSL